MQALLEELLAGDAAGPSALDIDMSGLGVTPPPQAPNPREERTLSAFDVADEDAEERAYARRRRATIALGLLGACTAVAGSVSIGF